MQVFMGNWEDSNYPLLQCRYFRILKYWVRILEMDNTRYVKAMYRQMYYDHICHQWSNWCGLVEKMLNELGMGNYWISQRVENKMVFLAEVQQRINDQYYQIWSDIISNDRKLKYFYSNYKDWGTEDYLGTLSTFKLRQALSKLRLSSHLLAIETGRWKNQERNERTCELCNSKDIEDEYHFVLICNKLQKIRKKFIPRYYTHRPSVAKFCDLMKRNENDIIIALASFIYLAGKERLSLLHIKS